MVRGRWPLRATGQQRSVDGDGDGDGDDHGHDGHTGPPEAHREGFGHTLRGLAAALRARRRGRAVTPPHTVTLHEWTVGQRPSVVPGGVLSPSPTGAPAGGTPIP